MHEYASTFEYVSCIPSVLSLYCVRKDTAPCIPVVEAYEPGHLIDPAKSYANLAIEIRGLKRSGFFVASILCSYGLQFACGGQDKSGQYSPLLGPLG